MDSTINTANVTFPESRLPFRVLNMRSTLSIILQSILINHNINISSSLSLEGVVRTFPETSELQSIDSFELNSK